MAVNGIEIKKGQQWRRRDGTVVKIAASWDSDVMYPVVDTKNERYTKAGAYEKERAPKTHAFDLVELVAVSPAAKAPAKGVNGVEIKVGQTWRCRDGSTAEIRASNGVTHGEAPVAVLHISPAMGGMTTDGCRTTSGRMFDNLDSPGDLVKLISDAPTKGVNDVEIKEGQKWLTNQRVVVHIVSANQSFARINDLFGNGFAVYRTGPLTGKVKGQQHIFLMELVEDAPTPTPHVDEVPMPIPEPIIGNAKAYLLAEAPKAPDLLEAAAGHMHDRAATYDKPEGERSMAQTVAIFNLHHGAALTEAQGWHFMQILKDVRLFTNVDQPHRDSGEDGIAYSALKVEALLRGGAQ